LEQVQGLIEKIRLNADGMSGTFNVSGITEIDNTQKQNVQELNNLYNQTKSILKDIYDLDIQVNEAEAKGNEQTAQQLKAIQDMKLSNLKDITPVIDENGLAQIQQYESQLQQINNLKQAQSNDKSIQQEISAQESLNKLQDDYLIKLKNIQTTNKDAFKSTDLKQQAQDFETQIRNLTTANVNTGQLSTSWKNLSSSVREANVNIRESNGVFGELLSNLGKMIQWSVVGTALFSSFNQLKDGISFINDLNKSMTNIQMITGMNSQQVQGLTKDYSNLAGQLHETTSSIMTASEEFLRAGNNAQQTGDLLKASTVMSKLAGQSQEDSAQSLIAIMNSYKMNSNEMMSVVDKMVAVD
jgi:hypothetical protein